MPRSAPLAAATLLALASVALGQTPTAPAQPAPAASPAQPAEPAKSEPKSEKPSGYPEKVDKKLFATNDLRGKKAPSLQVEAWRLEGKEIKAPDLKNKTIMLDFWGIGCAPCRTLIPELEQWQEKYKSDLIIIGVGGENPKALDNFEDLRGNKIKYTLAIDTQNRTNRDVGVEGIPHVLVISSDGIVRWQGFPLSQQEQLTEEMLKRIIDTDKAARSSGGTSAEKPAEPAKDAKPAESKPVAAKPAEAVPAKK